MSSRDDLSERPSKIAGRSLARSHPEALAAGIARRFFGACPGGEVIGNALALASKSRRSVHSARVRTG
jgi:hypothetical protein